MPATSEFPNQFAGQYTVVTVPGDGSIDFRGALAPVAKPGYSGWWIVEAGQDPAKAHPLTYARKGFTHLRATAEALSVPLAA